MVNMKNIAVSLLIFATLAAIGTACTSNSPAKEPIAAAVAEQVEPVEPAMEDSGEKTESEMQQEPSLATEGQPMTFTASDDTQLEGVYYPAEKAGAPLIILMHWAPGDQTDYVEIAYWLQNQGLGGKSENPDNLAWLDSSWFPEIEADKSYAVFTFNFRNCAGGCQSFMREEWLDDAQSAVDFAYELEGIDQQRVLLVGASIGADGAADGCLYLNDVHPDSCQGAFSISPGDYLTQSYADTVAGLGEATEVVPAWCLYAPSDVESAGICGTLEADNYTPYQIGDGHGMQLVQPEVQPNPLDLLLAFIAETID